MLLYPWKYKLNSKETDLGGHVIHMIDIIMELYLNNYASLELPFPDLYVNPDLQ